jgi:hypothetical protein
MLQRMAGGAPTYIEAGLSTFHGTDHLSRGRNTQILDSRTENVSPSHYYHYSLHWGMIVQNVCPEFPISCGDDNCFLSWSFSE